jgi:hypothetical protein
MIAFTKAVSLGNSTANASESPSTRVIGMPARSDSSSSSKSSDVRPASSWDSWSTVNPRGYCTARSVERSRVPVTEPRPSTAFTLSVTASTGITTGLPACSAAITRSRRLAGANGRRMS